jgi:excisionase family DNA binding protein
MQKQFSKVSERRYTVGESAERFGLKECTVRAWVLKRKIAYYKIGRSVRIPESEIERVLAEGFVPAR